MGVCFVLPKCRGIGICRGLETSEGAIKWGRIRKNAVKFKGLIIWKRGSPVDGLGHLLRFDLC